MKKYLRKLLYLVSENKYLYRLAKRIVFDHRGENNCEIETNGEMSVLKKYLKNGDTVFDVGANVGDWTKTVLGIIPDAAIHSFEPCLGTFSTLKENNFPANVILNNFGLGSKNEEKDFYITGEDSTVNSLYLRNDILDKNNCRKETISLKSLDNYCAEKNVDRIDFLKIDVEGNEFEVLLGAKRLLSENKIGLIQLEYGGTYIDSRVFLRDVFDYFHKDNKFSYSFYKILYNKILRVEYSEDLENFQYCNYLIVNNNFKIAISGSK